MKYRNTFSITKTAEELVPDFTSRTSYFVAIGIILILLAILFLTWGKLPSAVPLFFTEPWGEARLAPRIWLLLLPALSFAVLVINVMLGKIGGNSSPVLPRMLSVTTSVVSLAMLLALLGIVQSLTL